MQDVGKLQRRCAGKQNFAGGSEFDDGAFLRTVSARLMAASDTAVARELDRNSNRGSFRKKTGEVGDRAVLPPARWSCSLLHQAMLTLSLPAPGLFPLQERFCLIRRCGWAPLFPVRKSIGEPEAAVIQEGEARPGPQCGTEGLVPRRYIFQQVKSITRCNA